jgi:hypothetical protein
LLHVRKVPISDCVANIFIEGGGGMRLSAHSLPATRREWIRG